MRGGAMISRTGNKKENCSQVENTSLTALTPLGGRARIVAILTTPLKLAADRAVLITRYDPAANGLMRFRGSRCLCS